MTNLATIHRQTLLWFDPDEPALYDPANCPVFIWMYGNTAEDYLYGFPTMPGFRGVKAATEHYGDTSIDPNACERDVPESEWRAIYDRHIGGRLRGLSDRLIKTATCLYTVTPDAGFIIDSLRADGTVIAASACSGHGFKHSPALGEYLADRATEATPAHDDCFGLARFAC